MRVLLLFGLFPNESRDVIIKNSKGVIQYAADTLQWSFIKGLSHYFENISLINLPYIGSFPKYYSKSKIKNYDFTIKNSTFLVKSRNIGFNNLFGLRLFSRYYNSNKAIKRWIQNSEGEKVIIIYALHIPFIEAAVRNKRLNTDVKICLIIPDLPEFMNDKKNNLRIIYESLLKKRLGFLYLYVDYFVLLTENMKNSIPIKNNKYTVIEGIFDNYEIIKEEIKINNKTKNIFYGGTLAHRYGVLNLVKAFTILKNKDYRLIICGEGSANDEIRKLAQNDSRIILKGQIPREEVLKIISESDLLVNPRTPDGEYTKYSFPSKTMEYLGSGIPTLLFKLEGIPEEYYHYCFSIDDVTIDALSKEINRILSMPKSELKEFGVRARNFILKNKNPILQCEKIVKLLNS